MKVEILTTNDNQKTQNYIIAQIRDFINYKNLEPGDKLPSERKLSEKFEVSRGSVREAIQRLEYYGLLRSKPQSGTFVADIGQVALNGMIDDILRLEDPDFKSLVETRILLELEICRLAALRRTQTDLDSIEEAMMAYEKKVLNDEDAVQEDLLFHLAIARASRNVTLDSFMLTIVPEIITNFEKYHVCDKNKSFLAIQEHKDIYEAIKAQDPKLTKEKVKKHFTVLYQYLESS